MEPIINPSIFYWGNVLDSLRKVGVAALVISVVVFIITGVAILVDLDWGEIEEKNLRTMKKLLIIAAITLSIAIIMIIFIPTRDTMYAMYAAEMITPDNIDAIAEKGEEGIQFIFEQIEQLMNNTTQSIN